MILVVINLNFDSVSAIYNALISDLYIKASWIFCISKFEYVVPFFVFSMNYRSAPIPSAAKKPSWTQSRFYTILLDTMFIYLYCSVYGI